MRDEGEDEEGDDANPPQDPCGGQQNAKSLKQQLKGAKEPFREIHQLRGWDSIAALPCQMFPWATAEPLPMTLMI